MRRDREAALRDWQKEVALARRKSGPDARSAGPGSAARAAALAASGGCSPLLLDAFSWRPYLFQREQLRRLELIRPSLT
jgi:hypothetical protein